MSIFTCNNCNYTFSAPEAVTSCPDCGKSVATRIVSNGVYQTSSPVAAIRPATEAEHIWFRRVQAELAEMDWLPERKEPVNTLHNARLAG